MKKITLFAFLVLTLLLAACGGGQTPTLTEEPTQPPPTPEPVIEEAPEPTASDTGDMGELTGTTWAWVGFTDPLQQFSVDNPLNYTLVFQDDGTVAIVADCNNGMGDYTLDGSSLTIEVGPLTRAMCPPESRSDDFLNYLGSAAIYFFENGNLYIDLMADGGTMAFAPQEVVMADDGEGAIAGAPPTGSWQWVSFTNPVEQFQIDDPENYVLTFNDDGSVNIKADCNNAMGSYTADSSSLTIEVGPTTLALCPGESRGEDFVKYLGFVAIYFFEDGHLFIDLMADGGTLEFAQASTAETMSAEAAQEISLSSHTWELGAYVTQDGVVDIENPEDYTLTFNPDSTLSVVADCNNANGSYTDDGESLSIEVDASTMALCPGGSHSEEYLDLLGEAHNYVLVQNYLIIALNDDSGVLNFVMQNVITAEFTPDAEPIYGTLTMGTENNLHVDPLMVSLTSGVVEGYGVDATTLGEACTGTIPSRPDVVFNWPGYEGVDRLRVFFMSTGDPTLLLVTPSGEVLCNDDFNPLMLDPYIEIQDPEPGRYAAFVGNFNADIVEPGFLVVTVGEYDPVNLDLAQLLPRDVDPRAAATEVLSMDVLDLESGSSVEPANGSLEMDGEAFTQELTAGGELGMFNLDQPNQLCTGFVSAAPSFRFDWSGDYEQLVLYFESDADATLNILAPDGNFYCDDDYRGENNLNPLVSLVPSLGTYYVWVGSFSPDVLVDGTLTITNEENAAPAVLTSADLE